MAGTETYQINRPWDGVGFYSSPDSPAIAAATKFEYGNGYQRPTVYDRGRVKFRSTDAGEMAAHLESERCRELYTSVILQTLLDMCNPRYQGDAQRHPTRYEAIEWVEGRTEDMRADRNEVLDMAGVDPCELAEGYNRIKQAGFDLRKVIDPQTLHECRDIIIHLTHDYDEIHDGKLH